MYRTIRKKIMISISVLIVLFFTGLIDADSSTEPVPIPKLKARIKVDGNLKESCWKKAGRLNLAFETTPGENIPALVKTEIFMFYTRTHLNFAVISQDPNPENIRARYANRDSVMADDMIVINLDTFNDERRNYFLSCNPLGVQTDGIETIRGNPSWDGIWKSAGKITDQGFIVEISIPFSSLQFPRSKEKQIWGLDISRWYQRDYKHRLGLVKIDRNNNSYQSQFLKIVGFENIKPGKNIEIIPTLVGNNITTRSPFPDGELHSEGNTFDPGITATWGVSSNLNLSGTINPDFSQVEADARQLDINQPFALFFQEKRPFFTEGSDFFSSPMDVLHTRTIREPEWGIKLSGKEGKNTIGAYFVRDERTNIIFPGNQGSEATSIDEKSTVSILRYKRDLGKNYSIGGIVTNRQSNDYFNRVFGIDSEARISNRNKIQFQIVGSTTKYEKSVAETYAQSLEAFSDRAIFVNYSYTSRNINFYTEYTDIGRDFRSDLGFMPKVDFRAYFGDINYRWQKNNLWWSEIKTGGHFSKTSDQEGNFLDEGFELYFNFEGTMQSKFSTEYQYVRESYNGTIYKLSSGDIDFNFRPASDMQLSANTSFGDRIDYSNSRLGKRFTLNSSINYNLGTHMKLTMSHTYENMKVNSERLYIANITQGSLVYHFNTKIYLRALIQYIDYQRNTENYLFEIDPEDRELFMQFLFSYQLSPRTLLFLGYTDNYLGYREYKSNNDVPLKQKTRTLFLKLSYSWQI